MKRGFLNTTRSKRVIEEAYAPRSPPSGPEPRRQQKSSPPRGENAAPAQDAMDVDMPAIQEVYADGRVVAVRAMRRSTEGEVKKQDGGEKAAHARNATDVEMTAVEEVYADGHVVAVRVIKSTDGEAKMSSKSRVDDNSAKTEAHRAAKDRKGKGKQKVVDTDDDVMDASADDDDPSVGSIPPRVIGNRHRPGWGRHPDEEFFHTVPPSHGGLYKKRAVFRFWPRDPNGKTLMPSEKIRGTLSPDGYPWGATLYDFYSVNRMPEVPNFVSMMTGSAMREIVEEMGELVAAAPEIEWARSEGKPRVEGAADTEELIRCIDTRLQVLPLFFPSQDVKWEKSGGQDGEQNKEDIAEQAPTDDDASDREDRDESEDEEEEEEEDEDEGTQPILIPPPPPPQIPVTSPFHPSHYPKPWPFTPFENTPTILLQERIPLHLLPQTLYVHDPFCLLSAQKRRFRDTSWTSRPDIVRTYNLHLSGPARWESEDARRKAKELEEFKSRTLIILRYKRTKEQIKNHHPVIEVPLPPYPRRTTELKEGHLYLSPVARVGEGHHSIVYKGEWELPRDLFTKQRICPLCFKESADKEVQRLKDTGRWDKMMRVASWGPRGFTGRQPTQAELDEVNDPTNLERDGEIIEREITCVVPPNAVPSKIVEKIDETDIWDALMKQKGVNAAQLNFIRDDDEGESTADSYVAHIRIDPPFSYESQKSCTHESSIFQTPVPRTAKFTVVVKLSLENDDHLPREANNYQKFPERFFQHYNGYTIISQLHTIVPVNAVVPQFYGYYTPKKDEAGNPGQPPYLSPILLLEHCGEPIDPDELSVEDQEECASLLLRFQQGGWIHESVAPRNFLVQKGKPTEFPLVRECKPELSFRLIDFGRSRKYDKASEKMAEEQQALRMFVKLVGRMGITLPPPWWAPTG